MGTAMIFSLMLGSREWVRTLEVGKPPRRLVW